jgi:hypothetical protein
MDEEKEKIRRGKNEGRLTQWYMPSNLQLHQRPKLIKFQKTDLCPRNARLVHKPLGLKIFAFPGSVSRGDRFVLHVVDSDFSCR